MENIHTRAYIVAFGLGQDIAAATECPRTQNYPTIRHVTVGAGSTGQSYWEVPSAKTTCTGKGFSPFSAVCWYFGKDVFESLGGKVPVGLIGSFVGGTSVERWSGPDAVAKCNQTGSKWGLGLPVGFRVTSGV